MPAFISVSVSVPVCVQDGVLEDGFEAERYLVHDETHELTEFECIQLGSFHPGRDVYRSEGRHDGVLGMFMIMHSSR